ncbi:hypothetical protein [Brevibacillus choshinensis]|nr:hypothetical protein [Brevibacillus choshinensis]
MAEVKHGGCGACQSKEQEILTSVVNRPGQMSGIALCDKCLPKK